MAQITRYVNLRSTPGGDGTTNATTGANRAYASIEEWNTNEATNIGADTHTVYLSGGTDTLSSTVDLDGWISSTGLLEITENPDSKYDPYTLDASNPSSIILGAPL